MPRSTYRLQDTGKNISSLALKPVLRQLPFFYARIGGVFASIKRIVAMIRSKMFLRWLSNWFYGICCSFLRTLGNRCKDTDVNVDSPILKPILRIFRSLLSSLLVILHQLDIRLPRYEQKHCFACFDTHFMAFAVLF